MGKIVAGLYEVLEKLGSGGGGVVYLGRHIRLNKMIVLKADKRSLSVGEEILRREVDLLKGLSNTYIPQVYDYVEENGVVYTVMDYIEGQSFDKILRNGDIPKQADVVRWACQLLDALNYLHTRPPYGILHGDIKPANIMLKPDGNICLIDYNIALALGEHGSVQVGYSRGYASPEHYGISFIDGQMIRSEDDESDKTEFITRHMNGGAKTTIIDDGGIKSDSVAKSSSGSSHHGKKVMLDVRSDIYSLGATLYHIISGVRPNPEAPNVIALTSEYCRPEIAQIINKAMHPEADKRYQSAAEMLKAFFDLYKNDSRTKKHKRRMIIAYTVLGAGLIFGAGLYYIGMKRQHQRQEALTLAEYSADSMRDGNVKQAVNYALQAIPANDSIFNDSLAPEAQKALTDALQVYELSDKFKYEQMLSLPSVPFALFDSPSGDKFAVAYAYKTAIYDTKTQNLMVELPIINSALADVVFVNEDTIVYAGDDGVTAYDLKNKKVLWKGDKATTISVSGDGKTVAALNTDENKCLVYSMQDGRMLSSKSLGEHTLKKHVNNILTNVKDYIFALNEDGSKLAISYDNGAVSILDLTSEDNDIFVYDESEYGHFEGGFVGNTLFLGADYSDKSGGTLHVIDAGSATLEGVFDTENPIKLEVNKDKVYFACGNILETIDPKDLSEKELIYTDDNKILSFFAGDEYILVSTNDKNVTFYDKGGHVVTGISGEINNDFLFTSGGFGVLGNRDENVLRVLRRDLHDEAEFASYDASVFHEEARVLPDKNGLMLFDYKGFSIFDSKNQLIKQVKLDNPDNMYDQQFRREGDTSYLEVIWYDGIHKKYDAKDGTLISEEQHEKPDKSLYEEFETSKYRFISSWENAPEIYDKSTGELVGTLEEDSRLTYVMEMGDYIVAQYVIMSDETILDKTAFLMNQKLEKLAILPNLCDVYDDTLYFDYGTGHIKKSKIYDIDELINIAKLS